MLILPILIVIFLQFAVTLYLRRNKSLDNFPAGPRSLPLVGSLLSVGFNLKDAFNRWRERYGDIVGFKLGDQQCVVINDFDILNEAFKDDRFCGRPKNLQTTFHALFQSDDNEKSTGGIFCSEGDAWREQRRFAMKTLKDFGAGKSSLQYVISEEVAKLVAEFRTETGRPISLKNRTNLAVVNTLWQILNGEKSSLADPQMQRVFSSTSTFIEDNNLAGPLFIFPWLRHLPGMRGVFEKARSSPQEMRRVTSRTIRNHIDTYDGETERDFIDCYLKKMSETTDPSSSFYAGHGEGNIQRAVMDLFGAGSETTSSILTFAINYMTRFPGIQTRVQEEIDAVLEGGRAAELEDRPRMPYMEAVIHEVLRHSCITYTSPHATTEDVTFHGYLLPKGTAVYADVASIMNDPKHWDQPDTFNPDRFLDSETGAFRRQQRCIPFLVGKRYCLGQQLALHQLFLFLTGLLQHFTFTTPLSSPEMVNTEPIVGFLHQCPEYDVILTQNLPLPCSDF